MRTRPSWTPAPIPRIQEVNPQTSLRDEVMADVAVGAFKRISQGLWISNRQTLWRHLEKNGFPEVWTTQEATTYSDAAMESMHKLMRMGVIQESQAISYADLALTPQGVRRREAMEENQKQKG